ncbi:MAG: transposase [Deltaproteobacteria bacterium]|nr:transposase [Deltaproteobacteria bacterium]
MTFPWELRRLAAFRADVVRAFTRRFSDAVFGRFRRRFRGVGRGGGVVFQQRSGGSINLHVHLHGLFLDGVFRRGAGDVLLFRRATPPTREELAEVLHDLRERCLRWLRREGLVDPEDAGATGDSSECGALEGLAQAAMQRGTVESLPLPGGAGPADADDLAFAPQPGGRWSVELDGWNLHAGVCIPAGDFEGRERLVRYAARPSLALGRLSELPDGRLAYRVRWARSASGPYRIMEPLDFLARLAAIVPPPRYPLLTYHGEELVSGPEAWFERICGYVGVPFEPQAIEYGKEGGEAPRPQGLGDPIGVGQHKRPSKASLDKWPKEFAQDPSKLELVRKMVERIDPEDLRTFGYEPADLWKPMESVKAGKPPKPPKLTRYRLERKMIIHLRNHAQQGGPFRRLLEKARLACDVLLRE